MEATTGDFARIQYQDIIKLYEQVRLANQAELPRLASTYADLQTKFRYIVDQTGEEVIRWILENHLDFLDQKFMRSNRDVDKQRKGIQEEIDKLNQQLRNLK